MYERTYMPNQLIMKKCTGIWKIFSLKEMHYYYFLDACISSYKESPNNFKLQLVAKSTLCKCTQATSDIHLKI